jgi:hypothetical protein
LSPAPSFGTKERKRKRFSQSVLARYISASSSIGPTDRFSISRERVLLLLLLPLRRMPIGSRHGKSIGIHQNSNTTEGDLFLYRMLLVSAFHTREIWLLQVNFLIPPKTEEQIE